MATAKRDVPDPRVQGPTIEVDEARLESAQPRSSVSGDGEVAAAAREIVLRARAKQGLPPKIQDPAVIARVVALLQPVVDD